MCFEFWYLKLKNSLYKTQIKAKSVNMFVNIVFILHLLILAFLIFLTWLSAEKLQNLEK